MKTLPKCSAFAGETYFRQNTYNIILKRPLIKAKHKTHHQGKKKKTNQLWHKAYRKPLQTKTSKISLLAPRPLKHNKKTNNSPLAPTAGGVPHDLQLPLRSNHLQLQELPRVCSPCDFGRLNMFTPRVFIVIDCLILLVLVVNQCVSVGFGDFMLEYMS